MRTIIAGGRDYHLTEADFDFLDQLTITEVVSGGARGADTGGEMYAHRNQLKVSRFPADWDRYGRRAGFIRNREMARNADAVVLFPGGRGTNSMYREAKMAHLLIYDRRIKEPTNLIEY